MLLIKIKKSFLCSVLLFVFFSSCYHDDKSVNNEIQKDYYNAIKEFVMSKKEYDQFLLISANKFLTEKDTVSGYLVGPLYPIMLELMNIDVFELISFSSNQSVYYTSDLNEIFVERDFTLKNIKDSIYTCKMYGREIYDRNPFVNFMKRSILLYKNKGKLVINYHPDTLFLPLDKGLIKMNPPGRSF